MTKNENAQMNEHNKPSQSLYSYKIRKCFDTFEIAPKIGFDIKEILNTKGGVGDDYASKYQHVSNRQTGVQKTCSHVVQA